MANPGDLNFHLIFGWTEKGVKMSCFPFVFFHVHLAYTVNSCWLFLQRVRIARNAERCIS